MFVRKKAAAALGASLIALSAVTAMPADARTVKIEGGIWDRGTDWASVWSNYYHPKKRHGSSVKGSYYKPSPCVGKKKWSRASAPRSWFGVNRAWYHFC